MAKKTPMWSDVKAAFKQLDLDQTNHLIHDLFKLSAENQTFLIGRLVPASREQFIKSYVKRV